MAQPVSDYYAAIEPVDVWLFPKVSSHKQRRYYDKSSLIHPAKMPTFFVQKILSEYSKPGDLVLDPMAGIGTTLVEAILLGRNAVGVEYEKKFVSIIEKNLKSVEAFRTRMPGMGRAIVLQGDSRELGKVLGENAGLIDTVAFSPPYSDISLKTGVDLKGRIHGRMFGDKRKFTDTDYKNVLLHEGWDEAKGLQYSKDPNNIGCLPHGSIDTVVTSPPYSEALNPKKNTGSEMKYSEDKQDISQIGSLPHGSIDAVVTSPPFSSSLAGSASDDVSKFKHGSAGKDYCEDKENKDQLANLAYGEIDAIVSSPPFEDNTSGLSHAGSGAEVLAGKKEPDVYTENKDDLTNLPNLSGETYLEAMLKVYKECFLVLKQGGIMALVTKNFVRGGRMMRLDLDTRTLCEAAGFTFLERKYRKLDTISFWIRNAKKKFYQNNPSKVSGDPFAEYEDVLVFIKKKKEAA
jgi:DNA modification methylase